MVKDTTSQHEPKEPYNEQYGRKSLHNINTLQAIIKFHRAVMDDE